MISAALQHDGVAVAQSMHTWVTAQTLASGLTTPEHWGAGVKEPRDLGPGRAACGGCTLRDMEEEGPRRLW